MRARVREQCREQQRLHHHLRVWIPRKPDFDHVESEQRCRRSRGERPEQPKGKKVDRENTERRPCRKCVQGSRQPIDSVTDRDRGWKEMRKLSDDRAGIGVLHEEAHEARTVVIGAWMTLGVEMLRNEQLACEVRQAGNHGILNDERAALRDLDPFIHVHTRVLAPDDVFGRRSKAESAKERQRQRNNLADGEVAHRIEPQALTAHCDRRDRDRAVHCQQPREAVAVCPREREND
jgi:hypothetical protein